MDSELKIQKKLYHTNCVQIVMFSVLLLFALFYGIKMDLPLFTNNFKNNSVDVPEYILNGEENQQLNTLLYRCCLYFHDVNAPWYKGDLDNTDIEIRVCDLNLNNGIYRNSLHHGENFIAVNYTVYDYYDYDTKSCLTGEISKYIESAVIHELIHIYMLKYYPKRVIDNRDHKGIYRDIEQSFLDKGVYLSQQYIRTDKELRETKRQYIKEQKAKAKRK